MRACKRPRVSAPSRTTARASSTLGASRPASARSIGREVRIRPERLSPLTSRRTSPVGAASPAWRYSTRPEALPPSPRSAMKMSASDSGMPASASRNSVAPPPKRPSATIRPPPKLICEGASCQPAPARVSTARRGMTMARPAKSPWASSAMRPGSKSPSSCRLKRLPRRPASEAVTRPRPLSRLALAAIRPMKALPMLMPRAIMSPSSVVRSLAKKPLARSVALRMAIGVAPPKRALAAVSATSSPCPPPRGASATVPETPPPASASWPLAAPPPSASAPVTLVCHILNRSISTRVAPGRA